MIVVRHPSRALAAPLLAALLALDLAAAERHELVISNEPAGIDIAAATLSGGHDGHLYLHQPGQTTIIRIASDGSRRAYTARSPALTAVAAGPDGSIATAHAHFQHRVDVHDAELVPRGGCADFLNDDQAGWISPCDVQAGRSGDFYAPDNARGRVLRLGPAGAVVATIPLDVLGTAWRADSVRLRVWEGGSLLYIAEDRSGILSAVRFDGTLAWSAPLPLGGNQWDGYAGAFDVDGNGRVHVLRRDGGPVMVYSHEGAALAPIALAGTLDAVAGIVVRDGAIHVKRRDQKELFRTYDRASGALVRTVPALVDVLSVTLGSDVIEAGRPAPATVEWASALTPRPRLTAWIARHPDGDFREVALDDGTLTTPDGVFGPCVLRVTTGADGSSGGHAVELPVEVRRTGSTGTITTWTRDGRHAFRRGEEVPLVLSVRGPSSPTDVELRLVAADGRVVATERVTVTGARDVPLTAGLTGALPPGRYEFEADAPGLTPVATAIELGVAASDANPFRITMYGDYVPAFGGTTATWPAEEIVARRARYERTLGLDTVVDRLHAGAGIDPLHGDARIALHAAWAERLESRPDGPDPARLRVIPTPLLRMIERRSASGIDQRGIALSMDAGVPLGVPGHGYDARSPDQVASDVARVTKGLSHIIGFRGWSWAANWWLDQRLPDDEGESKAFLAARERALTDGGWDPILDTVTDRRIGSPDEARRGLDAAARAAAPGKTLSNAMTGPWRQPGIIPPTTFAGTDEVDLHVQLEQIGYPHAAGQLADFLARPGKPAWAHPEIWNDDGTGDQILTTHAMLAMTGATGIGSSPLVCPQMAFTDPRSGYRGRISAHRASHRWFDLYGPWLAELRRSPTILIPVSTRMMRIDEWANVGGRYFTALYEAWNACAFAARPASFVFVDDLDGVDWDGVSAVLVVAQRADAEPRLARALRDAKARGIVVVADGTSRAAAVPDASVIAVSFDRALADEHPLNDDHAHARLQRLFHEQGRALTEALGERVPAIVAASDGRVLMRMQRGGAGRFLWVVNNNMPAADPDTVWRRGLYCATRDPVAGTLTLPPPTAALYDVTARRRVEGAVMDFDLTDSRFRLYAALPRAIADVRCACERADDGQLEAEIGVVDAAGTAIDAVLPVRIRILDDRGAEIEARTIAVGRAGARIRLPLPRLPRGGTIAASDLIVGKHRVLRIDPASDVLPLLRAPAAAAGTAAFAAVRQMPPSPPTWDELWGPSLGDVAVSDDGGSILATAFRSGDNAFALDARTGAVAWRHRVGDHVAFRALPLAGGWGIWGLDAGLAEGHVLHVVDRSGAATARFAAPMVAHRGTFWFMASWPNGIAPGWACDRAGRVVAAGGLGVAAWSPTGKLLWESPAVPGTDRPWPLIAAAGEDLVAIATGRDIEVRRIADGRVAWSLKLPHPAVALWGAGGTVVVRTSEGGEALTVLAGAAVRAVHRVVAHDLAISPDGASIAVTTDDQLRWLAASGGLGWHRTGDASLRGPRFSRDGRRLCVGSEAGTLLVVDDRGRTVLESDAGALPVGAWMADGDVVVATWAGEVMRLGMDGTARWRTRIVRSAASSADRIPPITRARRTTSLPRALPLRPNLLAAAGTVIEARWDPAAAGIAWRHAPAILADGDATAPAEPWLPWHQINYVDSGWMGKMTFVIELPRPARVDAVTVVGDPRHPASSLPDAQFETWDEARAAWTPVATLLADASTHSHRLPTPVVGRRFRLASPGGGSWPVGNLRLGELVLHGEEAP